MHSRPIRVGRGGGGSGCIPGGVRSVTIFALYVPVSTGPTSTHCPCSGPMSTKIVNVHGPSTANLPGQMSIHCPRSGPINFYSLPMPPIKGLPTAQDPVHCLPTAHDPVYCLPTALTTLPFQCTRRRSSVYAMLTSSNHCLLLIHRLRSRF